MLVIVKNEASGWVPLIPAEEYCADFGMRTGMSSGGSGWDAERNCSTIWPLLQKEHWVQGGQPRVGA